MIASTTAPQSLVSTAASSLSRMTLEELLSMQSIVQREVTQRLAAVEAEKHALITELAALKERYPYEAGNSTFQFASISSSSSPRSKGSFNIMTDTPARLKAKAERMYQLTTKQGFFSVLGSYIHHKDSVWEATRAPGSINVFGTCSSDKTALLWACPTSDGKCDTVPVLMYSGHTGSVNSIRFSSGSLPAVVTASGDKSAHIWKVPASVNTSSNLATIPEGALYDDEVKSHKSGGEGDSLQDHSDTIGGHRKEGGKNSKGGGGAVPTISTPLLSLQEHASPVVAAEWVNDRTNSIVTGSWDKTAKIWDLQRGDRSIQTLTGHSDKITNVTGQASLVLTSSCDATFRLWDLRTSSFIIKVFRGHTETVRSSILSPSESIIVSGGDDATVKVWDLRTMKETTAIHCSNAVNRLSLSPSGTLVAVPGDSGTARVYDLAGETRGVMRATRKEDNSVSGHIKSISSAAWVSEETLITTSIDMNVLVWRPPPPLL